MKHFKLIFVLLLFILFAPRAEAAFTFIATTTTSTSNNTITIDKPAGVSTGDLLVASLLHDLITVSGFTSTGWTQQAVINTGNCPASSLSHAVMTHVVEAGDGANYTFTATGGDAQNFDGSITAFATNGQTVSIDGVTSSCADNTIITTSAVTPVSGGTLFASFSNDSIATVTSAPASMTQATQVLGSGQSLVSYYQLNMAATPVTKSLTWSATEQIGGIALTFSGVSNGFSRGLIRLFSGFSKIQNGFIRIGR